MARRSTAFRLLARQVLGRDLLPKDGIEPARLRAAERRLGVRLPEAVKQYYLMAGANARLNCSHNRLLRPEELALEDGRLVFMEENQEVVHWGIPVRSLEQTDPMVWQRVNGDKPRWFSEHMRFSEFIVKNVLWQAGIEESG